MERERAGGTREVAGGPLRTQFYANVTSSSEVTKGGTAFVYSHCANRQGPGKDVTAIQLTLQSVYNSSNHRPRGNNWKAPSWHQEHCPKAPHLLYMQSPFDQHQKPQEPGPGSVLDVLGT